VLPSLLDGLPHFVELLAVPANQRDSAVPGQLQCREASYAGGRTGSEQGRSKALKIPSATAGGSCTSGFSARACSGQ
jgi:hypothetical protein